MDGRNPAPPKTSWGDAPRVNTSKQWFAMASKWCERISSTHSMQWVRLTLKWSCLRSGPLVDCRYLLEQTAKGTLDTFGCVFLVVLGNHKETHHFLICRNHQPMETKRKPRRNQPTTQEKLHVLRNISRSPSSALLSPFLVGRVPQNRLTKKTGYPYSLYCKTYISTSGGSKPTVPFSGGCATHFRTYFSGWIG